MGSLPGRRYRGRQAGYRRHQRAGTAPGEVRVLGLVENSSTTAIVEKIRST
nr:hypothetical protein [Pseudomonas borbori]